MSDALRVWGTCDWGGCDEISIALRWWAGGWFPVCEHHIKPALYEGPPGSPPEEG